MSSFVIKLFAVLFMCCDHIGKAFFPNSYFLYLLGVCSFPLFAFQIVQGYLHTSDVKKYLKRLSLFALISQVPFMLFIYKISGNIYKFNIFFTLSLGVLLIYIFDKVPNKIYKILSMLAIFAISIIFPIDYGFWGLLLILSFFILRNNKILFSISYILLCISKYLPLFFYYSKPIYLYFLICTIIPLCFMLLYNSKQGPKIKAFFYMFYPIHLSIIYLLFNF